MNPNGPTTPTSNGGTQNGSSIPSYTFPLTLNVGLGTYYSNILPKGQITSSMNYLDPRLGGRSPEFVNYSIGFQRSLFKGMIASVNYVANHGRFLAVSGNRGEYINQAAPGYLVARDPISSAGNPKASILSSSVATTADLAKAQALFPSLRVDPTFPTTQNISQLIKPFPQYNGISDAFDSDGNTSGTTDIPNQVTGYAVYDIPTGKGHLVGGDNPIVDQIVGGWRLSGVVTYDSGSPLTITTGAAQPRARACRI